MPRSLGQHTLKAGEYLDVVLPSGRVINIEVTQDTASVVLGDQSLFNENLDDGAWQPDWPAPFNRQPAAVGGLPPAHLME